MPDLRALEEELKPSKTDKGDGKNFQGMTIWSCSSYVTSVYSYFRYHSGHSDDYHALQKVEVAAQDCLDH
jgi:hypothetical protein